MAKAWFKFFPANFTEATYSWSPATVGIYMRLLVYQFSNGSIPSDEESCIAIANCQKEDWLAAWALLSGKFTAGDENGENPVRMVNLKMLETRSEAEKSYEKRALAAAKSHESRRRKNCNANAKQGAMHLQGASGSSSGSGSSSKGKKKASFDALECQIPESLDSDGFRVAWGDWVAHRVEIKKPMTETHTKTLLKKLEGWGPVRSVAALKHTIGNGWQGLREPDGESSGHDTARRY